MASNLPVEYRLFRQHHVEWRRHEGHFPIYVYYYNNDIMLTNYLLSINRSVKYNFISSLLSQILTFNIYDTYLHTFSSVSCRIQSPHFPIQPYQATHINTVFLFTGPVFPRYFYRGFYQRR